MYNLYKVTVKSKTDNFSVYEYGEDEVDALTTTLEKFGTEVKITKVKHLKGAELLEAAV